MPKAVVGGCDPELFKVDLQKLSHGTLVTCDGFAGPGMIVWASALGNSTAERCVMHLGTGRRFNGSDAGRITVLAVGTQVILTQE